MLKKLLVSAVTATVLFTGSAFASTPCSVKNGGSVAQYMFVPRIVSAVSKVGINAGQTEKIALGIIEYKATITKIKQMQIFPVDSFIHDEFDESKFMAQMSEKHIAKIAAKAALFKYVFAVLNNEQRKAFKNAYAAPMIEGMIKANY